MYFNNKQAFQCDAYHPLVDREGVVLSEGERWCCLGGTGAVQGEVLSITGSDIITNTTTPMDRQTDAKTLPSPKLRLRTVNI